MSNGNDYQLVATDDYLKRNRGSRMGFMLFSFTAIMIALSTLGTAITHDFFGYGIGGFFIGLIAAILIIGRIAPRFFVKNGAYREFVTIDQLRTFLKSDSSDKGDPDVYVAYGPGLHVSYPWESRNASRNISLEEASEDFEAKIQTESGIITVRGSVRMRPDIRKYIEFLGGVASVASEVTDIIIARVIKKITMGKDGEKKSVKDILGMVNDFNDDLTTHFGTHGNKKAEGSDVSDFEERFGVVVSDVTIAQLLPSEEVQKTLSGLTEADVIGEGTARSLGYETAAAARRAVAQGKISQDDFNKARDRFMAASENITMHLDANEYTIRFEGLEPEVIEALASAAPLLLTARAQQAKKASRSGGKKSAKRTGKKRASGGDNE